MTEPHLKRLSDEALLAFKQGPSAEDAFEELASRFEARLYYVALRTLRDTELSKDAVQEALLRAWRHRSEFRQGSRVSTWMFSILLNWCRDQLRRRKRERTLEDPGVAIEAESSRFRRAQENPEGEAERHELSELLIQAMESLPPVQAQLMKLRAGSDIDFEAAGKKLGLSPDAARAAASRAYKKLRQFMTKKGRGKK